MSTRCVPTTLQPDLMPGIGRGWEEGTLDRGTREGLLGRGIFREKEVGQASRKRYSKCKALKVKTQSWRAIKMGVHGRTDWRRGWITGS